MCTQCSTTNATERGRDTGIVVGGPVGPRGCESESGEEGERERKIRVTNVSSQFAVRDSIEYFFQRMSADK